MTGMPRPLTRRAALRAIATGGALAASIAIAGCGIRGATSGGAGGTGGAAPTAHPTPGTLVMIIRHGEKPDGSDKGFDPSGHRDKSSLTRDGYARASKLPELFAPAQGPLRPGLARPKFLYAAGANSEGKGKRTWETLTPLSQRLGIPVNTDFGKGDEDALVARVISQPGPTLISWQHGEIPQIVAAFGNISPTPPDSWPDDRYDLIWTLTASGAGWTFAQLPEMIMPDDQPTVAQG